MKFGAALAGAFLGGLGLTWALNGFFSASERALPALAASFIINLVLLAVSLTLFSSACGARLRFVRAWLIASSMAAAAFLGAWAAPAEQRESLRIFAVLALLSSAQCAALGAVLGQLSVIFNGRGRAPRLMCAFGLLLLTTALFWSREPIMFASKSGGALAEVSPRLADGVMKFAPPMNVASAWFSESDAGRGSAGNAAARFDLVHGPMTYAVWIGSYQAVAMPGILPTGVSRDFYAREDFSAGIALALLAWALPLMVMTGALSAREMQRVDPKIL